MLQRYTLQKHQILRSKKEIEFLFENGKSIQEYPLKAIYFFVPKNDVLNEDRFRVLFVVPKRNIKKAAHRNRIKRKIKESFRLQQFHLNVPDNQICLLALIYTEKTKDEIILKQIDNAVLNILKRIK
ncbi:MAG: hypothetical protein OHK0036_08800 [Bacteroidia bacterium]